MVDLGCAQLALGNVLFEMFRSPEVSGLITSPNGGLSRLMTYLKDGAAALNVALPFTKMKLSMIRNGNGQPSLHLKAAKTRRLLPIVIKMLELHFPAAVGSRAARRHMCLQCLSEAYAELDAWRDGSAERLEDACRRHLLLYASFSREAVVQEGTGDGWKSWRFFQSSICCCTFANSLLFLAFP